jgi:hypothetical protein
MLSDVSNISYWVFGVAFICLVYVKSIRDLLHKRFTRVIYSRKN